MIKVTNPSNLQKAARIYKHSKCCTTWWFNNTPLLVVPLLLLLPPPLQRIAW